jgi:hypothetical protein
VASRGFTLATAELTAPTAVGSGDLLGHVIVDSPEPLPDIAERNPVVVRVVKVDVSDKPLVGNLVVAANGDWKLVTGQNLIWLLETVIFKNTVNLAASVSDSQMSERRAKILSVLACKTGTVAQLLECPAAIWQPSAE